MSTATSETSIDLDDVEFTFGEAKEGTLKKNGDILVAFDNSAFLDNASKAGISKQVVQSVFKYTKKYNEELVKHATAKSVSMFKKDKDIKRVVAKAGYGMGGSAIVTTQKSKTKTVGALGSGVTVNEPYVSMKIKDKSLPHKDYMKEITAGLIKKIK